MNNKFQAAGFPQKSLGYTKWGVTGNQVMNLPTNNERTLFYAYASSQENAYNGGGGDLSASFTIGTTVNDYQPTAPYVALDNAYIHLILAESLPSAIRSYAYDSMIATVLSTLIATLISILVMGSLWGVLGQLMGAMGSFGGYATGSLAVIGGPAALASVNLLAGVPSKTRADMDAQELGRLIRDNITRKDNNDGNGK